MVKPAAGCSGHFAQRGSNPSIRGIEPGLLTRVRGGARVLSADWDALFGEGRLRTLAHAVAARAENESAANSHTTAAALHGLSLYRTRTDRVHLIVPGSHTRKNSRDVIRHHLPLDSTEVDVIDGLRVTTLERTVYNVIRTASLETAVACARCRATPRRVGRKGTRVHPFCGRGIARCRHEPHSDQHRCPRHPSSALRRWIRRWACQPARRTSADYGCGSWDAATELQWRVDLGAGRFALLDFASPQLRRWAEFDGEVKYTDPEILNGRTAEQVRESQDLRERAVRRATGWRVDRWGFDRMHTLDAFAGYLRGLGFTP